MHLHENHTVPLGFVEDDPAEPANSSVVILVSASSRAQRILNFPKQYQWFICRFFWLLFLLGYYFKQFVYKFLVDEYNKKSFKLIDILTLLLAVSQHIAIAVWGIKITLVVLIAMGLENIGAHWFCAFSTILIDLMWLTQLQEV
jgi:hypothetical protein